MAVACSLRYFVLTNPGGCQVWATMSLPWPEGRSTVTTTFVAAHGQTTVTLDIQYLTREARDAAMQPGFAEGYEASYTQLDTLVKELQIDS